MHCGLPFFFGFSFRADFSYSDKEQMRDIQTFDINLIKIDRSVEIFNLSLFPKFPHSKTNRPWNLLHDQWIWVIDHVDIQTDNRKFILQHEEENLQKSFVFKANEL